jgi:hypothetical protein
LPTASRRICTGGLTSANALAREEGCAAWIRRCQGLLVQLLALVRTVQSTLRG